MTLAIVAFVLSLKPLTFPPEPIPFELKRGEKVYYQGRGLEKVLAEDRKVIGTWFDGRIQRDVEDAVWLSPSLVSRWLGYLNTREKWSQAELLARWRLISKELNGKITFIVQLSALPRTDPLELADDASANFDDARQARFLITHRLAQTTSPEDHAELGALVLEPMHRGMSLNRSEPQCTVLGAFRSYDWHSMFAKKWYRLSPAYAPLMPEFEAEDRIDPYRNSTGDALSVIYRVEVPLGDTPIAASEIQLRVFTRRREMAPRFSLRNPSFRK